MIIRDVKKYLMILFTKNDQPFQGKAGKKKKKTKKLVNKHNYCNFSTQIFLF